MMGLSSLRIRVIDRTVSQMLRWAQVQFTIRDKSIMDTITTEAIIMKGRRIATRRIVSTEVVVETIIVIQMVINS